MEHLSSACCSTAIVIWPQSPSLGGQQCISCIVLVGSPEAGGVRQSSPAVIIQTPIGEQGGIWSVACGPRRSMAMTR